MKPEEKIKKDSENYAKKSGVKLNPDSKRVDEVIAGLLKKKEKYGEIYCPCRLVSGNKEKDKGRSPADSVPCRIGNDPIYECKNTDYAGEYVDQRIPAQKLRIYRGINP